MNPDPLYEGKAKKMYATEDPGVLRVYYKDDATAFNAAKKGTIAGKGIVNNLLSAHFFRLIADAGIPTHFLRRLSPREMLVRKAAIIPVEVIVRNRAAGSMARRLGLEEGTLLAHPCVEYSYKNDALNDPLVPRSYVTALKWADRAELEQIERWALEINEILKRELAAAELELIDFKLEFGRATDGLLLADEISPDTCRFWDLSSGKKLDKDRFRHDLGQVEEAYREVLHRLTGLEWSQVQQGKFTLPSEK